MAIVIVDNSNLGEETQELRESEIKGETQLSPRFGL
jgi:hypothetical protein